MLMAGDIRKVIVLIALGALCLLPCSLFAADSQEVTQSSKLPKTSVPLFQKRAGAQPGVPIRSGRNEGFERYTSIFSGPPGPTLPIGAAINPSANGAGYVQPTVFRVSASSKLVVVDLPPGARRVTTVVAAQ